MKDMLAACAAAVVYGLVSQAWAQDGRPADPPAVTMPAVTMPAVTMPVVTMRDAVARALQAAPSISAGEEAVRASGGALRQARARPNPTVAFEADEFAGSGAFSGIDSAEFTLSVGQRIERGGKRRARVGLAQADRDLARLSASIARHEVIFEARRAYVDAMAAAAALDVAESSADAARDLEQTVARRVRSARDPAAAEQRVAAVALVARSDVDQARYGLRRAKRHLSALWGQADDRFDVDRARLFDIAPVDATALTARLDDVPDLLAARMTAQRAAAALVLERARAKQDPTIGLGLRQFQETDDVAAMVSFSLPLALFDTNKGNIARAAAQRRRADLLARDARLRLDRDVTASLETLSAAHAEARAFRDEVIPMARTALDETRAGYERGAFGYLAILDAQQALQRFQAREISALKRFHLAKASLDRLLAAYDGPLAGEETSQ